MPKAESPKVKHFWKVFTSRNWKVLQVEDAGLSSAGGGDTSSPASSESSTPAPADAGEASSQSQGEASRPSTEQPASRPSLSELVTKHLPASEQAPAPAAKDAADAAPPQQQKPAQQPAPKPTPTGEQQQGQQPALDPKAADATGKDGTKAADAKPEDEPELLSDEDIDKNQHAPKGLRDYSKKVTQRYRELSTLVGDFGGIKALKTLEAIAVPLTGTDRESAKQLQTLIKERNPALLENMQTDIFYGAVDEQPQLLETLIKTSLGTQWDGETLKAVKDAVDNGEIDLEEVKAAYQSRSAQRDPEAHKKIADLEKQVAQLKPADGETPEQKATRERVDMDVNQLRTTYSETVTPVLRDAGFGITKDDPPQVQATKGQILKLVQGEMQEFCQKNTHWKSLNRMMASGAKGEIWDWTLDRAMTSAVGHARELKTTWLPILNAFLQTVNASALKKNSERPPSAADELADLPSRDVDPNEANVRGLNEDQRAARMASIVRKRTG